jgi:hypothetical protein
MQHVWGTGYVHTGFWWENLRERCQLEGLGIYCKIILKWLFKKWDGVTNWSDLTQYRDR